jgi:hypothetical protein
MSWIEIFLPPPWEGTEEEKKKLTEALIWTPADWSMKKQAILEWSFMFPWVAFTGEEIRQIFALHCRRYYWMRREVYE